MQEKRVEGNKREYIIYSIVSAILYLIPVIYFLKGTQYSKLYLLFIGNFLFGSVVAIYTFKISGRNQREKSVSILKQGHILILSGILLSALFSFITVLIFFPHLFSWHTQASLVHNFPAGFNIHYPAGILLLVLFNIIICNTTVGSFVNVLTVYAWKRIYKY